jgi:Protein of unknown function (DUF3800)
MSAFRLHRERFAIVLQSYLDDAGTTDELLPVVVVGGLISDNTVWDAFDLEWSKFLADFEVGPRFHAAPFLGRCGRPYSKWSNEKWENARDAVCEILSHHGWIGIGTAVSRSAFYQWRDSIGYYISPDPYYFCLNNCLRKLIRGIRHAHKDDGIAIYIDQDKGREKLGQELAKWNETRLRRDPGYHVDPARPISTIYGSCINYKPLQAADIFANAVYQLAVQLINNGDAAVPNVFYQAIHNEGKTMIGCSYLFTKDLFDIEAKSLLYNGERR